MLIEDSTEVWYEQESGKAGEKGTSIREYVLDVTREEGIKGPFSADAGAPITHVYRVAVRFPVPKVQPPDARDVHAINRLLWDARKEIAKCYYKGPGRDGGPELSMVAFLAVDKKGAVTASGIEKQDEPLQKTGAGDCILENAKGLSFPPAGDDTKVRFKLKLQTTDVTGQADVKAPPKPKE